MGAINRTPALPFLRVHHGSYDPTIQSAIGAQIVKPLIPRHIPASFPTPSAGARPKPATCPPRNDNKAGQPAEGRSKHRPYTCFLPIRVGTGFRKPISNLMIHVPSVGVHEILPVHDPGSVIDLVEALPGLQRSFTDIRVLDFQVHRT